MSSPQPAPSALRPLLSIVPADDDTERWDAFVQKAEASSFCHLAGWRAVVEDVMGQEPVYVVAEDDEGRWHGVLPLVHFVGPFRRRSLISMPFLNYGGPLGSEPARARLVESALALAGSRGVDRVELRQRGPGPGHAALVPGTRKVTVVLDLPASVEALWAETFTAKVRNQVRRPSRAGMEARFGPQHLDAFYTVFAHHMRDLGTPVLPRAFFEAVARVFSDRILCAVVYSGDAPVAGGLGFFWRDEFEIVWASALREYSRQAPNMLLYAACMEESIRREIRRFNFGRCTPGGGTHRFKQQWGGRDEPLHWVQSSKASQVGGRPKAPTRRTGLRLAAATWRRLPLGVTNRLGPRLSPRLPWW